MTMDLRPQQPSRWAYAPDLLCSRVGGRTRSGPAPTAAGLCSRTGTPACPAVFAAPSSPAQHPRDPPSLISPPPAARMAQSPAGNEAVHGRKALRTSSRKPAPPGRPRNTALASPLCQKSNRVDSVTQEPRPGSNACGLQADSRLLRQRCHGLRGLSAGSVSCPKRRILRGLPAERAVTPAHVSEGSYFPALCTRTHFGTRSRKPLACRRRSSMPSPKPSSSSIRKLQHASSPGMTSIMRPVTTW